MLCLTHSLDVHNCQHRTRLGTVLEMSPDPLLHHSTAAYIIQRQQIIYSSSHIPLLSLQFPIRREGRGSVLGIMCLNEGRAQTANGKGTTRGKKQQMFDEIGNF